MSDSQPISPRLRLQALLAVPERQRTDEEWDELNELEIRLAPANRAGAPEHTVRQDVAPRAHRKLPGKPRGKKPAEKFHKRPNRRHRGA